MSIDVAINHRTSYKYDRLVSHAPHVIRLRPAPHARTRILSYTQRIAPDTVFVNWQQDAFSNYLSRVVFPERTDHFEVEVDLIARLEAINPFDFFLEEHATGADFAYEADVAQDLTPYFETEPLTPKLREFLAGAPPRRGETNTWLVDINQYVESAIGYIVRLEPGVQTPEETLQRAKGSCRDSSWLLVQMLRRMGLAARFVSGYLVQLAPDMKSVTGPSGPEEDFTDLHAWAEVYLPGAGWVGLDPTSGLFASEGHIPLAATPNPRSAAPIAGALDPCEVEFDFSMSVTRVSEPPRFTKPLTEGQWASVLATGKAVDKRLEAGDVRLTVGGEPTFIAADDRDAEEWTLAAVGPTKRAYADKLIRRFRDRFAPGGALHYGQGKWYPGEQLPRWAFELHWRGDGAPLWKRPDLIASEADTETPPTPEEARMFARTLCTRLGLPPENAVAAYEDPVEFALREQNLPPNATPKTAEIKDPMLRQRLVRVFEKGLADPVAFVLPLQQAQSAAQPPQFLSELWNTRRGRVFLIPGDSPAGLRLPLEALPVPPEGMAPIQFERDSFAQRGPLPPRATPPSRFQSGHEAEQRSEWLRRRRQEGQLGAPVGGAGPGESAPEETLDFAPKGGAVRTALTIEPRNGVLCVFLPPVYSVEGYLALMNAIEDSSAELNQPVHVEGYPPPSDPRLNVIKVTPDPGVIEINVHPAKNFEQQVAIIDTVYEEARQIGLDASTFLVDGRPTGSGGGNHIVMGGETPSDSPFLRRPDLLASIIRYWQNHPSLSYLFSGLFVGPTSQAPRLDEARHDALYEMEMALDQMPAPANCPPWLVDRMFRNLLIDVTGNTHRAEICIDKLYSPDGPAGRLGLVEFRGFEMPPHPKMASAQALVLRALVALFWEKPYTEPLKRYGTRLHDEFMLPAFVEQDFRAVLSDLSNGLGLSFDPAWFAPQFSFRFNEVGSVNVAGARIELRTAIEPWPVLGEEGMIGGVTRFVDSSLERLEVRIFDLPDGMVPTCNGIAMPLNLINGLGLETGLGPTPGREETVHVSGVRFRAWWPAHCLHPQIAPHAPLVFDLVDLEHARSVGGCTYRVDHAGGRAHELRPVNALEAEGRRLARFTHDYTPGHMVPRTIPIAPEFPVTLDLRRG